MMLESSKDAGIPEPAKTPQADEARDLAESPYPRLEIPQGETPDIFAYLQSLPDVDLPPGFHEENAEKDANAGKTGERIQTEALAEKIRKRTKALEVTAYAWLLREDSEAKRLLELFSLDEAYNDIVQIAGQKDTYYYSSATMTSQYATIAVLIEEKDHLLTVAQMVRYHAKTYPSPTAERYFLDPPYNFPKPQMEQLRRMFANHQLYADIKEVTTKNGKVYLYSSEHMTERYAQALADRAEEPE